MMHLPKSRENFLPLFVAISIGLHAMLVASWYVWGDEFTPPQPLGIREGVISIDMIASVASTASPEAAPEQVVEIKNEIPPEPIPEPKIEPKEEPKKEEPKKVEPKKVEPKKEEPKKVEKKEEPKKLEPKKVTEKPKQVAPEVSQARPDSIASDQSQKSEGAVADELPKLLTVNREPPCPPEALNAIREGRTLRVMLLLDVQSDGRVGAISVYISSGIPALDQSTLDTVRNWVFAPAKRGGRPIPYQVQHPVDFSAKNR